MTATCITCNIGIEYITKATKYCALCKKKMRDNRTKGYHQRAKDERIAERKSKTTIHPMFLVRNYSEANG